jgi:hypothetical protein
MKPIARLFAIAPAVVLFMAVTPSWGEPPDPTDSEAPRHIAGNTACGGVALNRAGFSTAIDNALSRNNLKPNADRHERQVLRAPPPNVGDPPLRPSLDPGGLVLSKCVSVLSMTPTPGGTIEVTSRDIHLLR